MPAPAQSGELLPSPSLVSGGKSFSLVSERLFQCLWGGKEGRALSSGFAILAPAASGAETRQSCLNLCCEYTYKSHKPRGFPGTHISFLEQQDRQRELQQSPSSQDSKRPSIQQVVFFFHVPIAGRVVRKSFARRREVKQLRVSWVRPQLCTQGDRPLVRGNMRRLQMPKTRLC